MRHFLKLAMLLSVGAVTGCATILQGTEDEINVKVVGHSHEMTLCQIVGDGRIYETSGADSVITVERGMSDLLVSCSSDTKKADLLVESSFSYEWLLVDLGWDFCLITMSCPIDAFSGAFFDYPNEIEVHMKSRDKLSNVE